MKGRTMRSVSICAAATLALVAATLTACSDGSGVGGPVGSGGSGPSNGTAGTPSNGGSSVIPNGGTGNNTAGTGEMPTAGTSPMPTAGSGGDTTIPMGGTGSGGMPPAGGAPAGGMGGAGGGTGGASGNESGPFKVLIISTTLEFHHDSIPACQQMVKDFGTKDANNTWTADIETDDLPHFTADGLKPYRLIFSCNPTGTVFSGNSKVKDKAAAMKAFQDFIEVNGGGFAGVHSASDFEKTNGFPWAINTLLGAYFDRHDNDGTQGSVTIDPTAAGSPLVKGLSQSLSTQDEWYYMNRDVSAQPGFKIIQRLAKDNRPVTWTKDFGGKGRMFYTIRGHNQSVYKEAEFLTVVRNGILWATKRL